MSEPFDRYFYYSQSVQSPEVDAEFFEKVYSELRFKKPNTLREDFCGTFANCCEWVKRDPSYRAYAIDNDNEPLAYGKSHYLSQLSSEQQARIEIAETDVLKPSLPPADIACALNFSYFCFKQRAELKNYFSNVYNSLEKDGIFLLDCFGGSKCQEANEEETEHEDAGFSYFWDQVDFDPITNESHFFIHFKRKNEPKREKVFAYDWRMWTIPELRDLLEEVGFKKSVIYWEGNDEEGDGNGEYERVEKGEECESWVAYIVGLK